MSYYSEHAAFTLSSSTERSGPGTVPDAGSPAVNKTDRNPWSLEFHSQGTILGIFYLI